MVAIDERPWLRMRIAIRATARYAIHDFLSPEPSSSPSFMDAKELDDRSCDVHSPRGVVKSLMGRMLIALTVGHGQLLKNESLYNTIETNQRNSTRAASRFLCHSYRRTSSLFTGWMVGWTEHGLSLDKRACKKKKSYNANTQLSEMVNPKGLLPSFANQQTIHGILSPHHLK